MCEAVPNNWSGAVLLPLFKKEDKRICFNYRGISLIGVAAKAFGIILLKRIQPESDSVPDKTKLALGLAKGVQTVSDTYAALGLPGSHCRALC